MEAITNFDLFNWHISYIRFNASLFIKVHQKVSRIQI